MATLPLSIDDLAHQAEVVCRGKIVARVCQRDPRGRIYTRVELDVQEVWKGALPRLPFVLVHGGGTLGTERVMVGGQTDYRVGEEIVAFVVLNPRGEGVPLSLGQGKFRVERDARTGTEWTWNLFHGTRPNAAAKQSVAPRASLTLAELRRRVESQRK